MANDLLDKVPDWLKSLWHMENELRDAARNGVILRTDEAMKHLAEARRHLEEGLKSAKAGPSAVQPTPPVSRDPQS